MPDGRTVVITGASAGVGRATARRFARDRARIGLIARGRAGLAAAADEVRAAGGTPHVVACDVADAAAVEAAAEEIEAALGPIDVWVNCAMVAVLAEVADTTPEEFRRVTEVTYLGSVHGTMAALRRMLPRDRGQIIQTGSALAFRGIPLQATYCGSKHALRGFFGSLRAELLHRGSGVRVTMVHLPGLDTTQFRWVRARTPRVPRPVAPVYAPELAADAVAWAADHPRRRELWVTGTVVKTIVGNRISGWLAERYLGATGVEGQQTDEELHDRPDYLDAPLDDEVDRGVHGMFGDEAHGRSLQQALDRRRGLLAAAALATGAGVVAAAAGRR